MYLIKFFTPSDTLIVNEEDIIIESLSINRYANKGETLDFGSIIPSELKVSVKTESFPIFYKTVSRIELYEDQEVIFIGKIEDFNANDYVISITALDMLITTDNMLSQGEIYELFEDKSITIKDLFTKSLELLQSRIGLNDNLQVVKKYNFNRNFENKIQTVMVGEISNDFIEKASLRVVLEWITQVLGLIIFMNGKNLIIKEPQQTNIILDHDEEISVDIGSNVVITQIEYQVEEETETEIFELTKNLGTKDEKTIKFFDNPIIHKLKDETIINDVFEKVKKYRWHSANINCVDSTYKKIDLFDFIKVKDLKNKEYLILITELNFEPYMGTNIKSLGNNWISEEENYSLNKERITNSKNRVAKKNLDLLKIEFRDFDNKLKDNEKKIKLAEEILEDFRNRLQEINERNNLESEKFNKLLDEKLKELEVTFEVPREKIDEALIEAGFDKVLIDDIRNKSKDNSDTLETVLEMIGNDGELKYNKNRATVTKGDLPLGTEYLEVGHNGDGFEVGQEYTISFLSECIQNPSSMIKYILNVPVLLGKIGLGLTATNIFYPKINETMTTKEKTVYSVFNDSYKVSVISDFYKTKNFNQIVNEDTDYIIDLEFKEIADANLEKKFEGSWGESPQIIFDGGN